MTEEEKYRLSELSELIYEHERPTELPDNVLAEYWRLNWKKEDQMKRGEMERENREWQASIIINILETFKKDCMAIAKTQLNNQRTRCLKLADKFGAMSIDLRENINTYFSIMGFWKM